MEIHEIKPLLDKYWAGESSLEEEKQLRDYFLDPASQLPAEWQPYATLFREMKSFEKVTPSVDFNEELLARLDSTPPKGKLIPFRFRTWSIAIAASISLAVVAWVWMDKSTPEVQPHAIDWSQYEPESPEEAALITRQALGFAAKKLEEGTKRAVKEIEKFEEIGKRIR